MSALFLDDSFCWSVTPPPAKSVYELLQATKLQGRPEDLAAVQALAEPIPIKPFPCRLLNVMEDEVTSNEAVDFMGEHGHRPATFTELLSFLAAGHAAYNVRDQRTIYALGSTVRDAAGSVKTPGCKREQGYNALRLANTGDPWSEFFACFLCCAM